MKKFLLFLMICGLSNGLMAQDNIFYLNYNWGNTTGDAEKFIDATSWKGFNFGMSKFVNSRFAAGLNVSWNSFYEKTSRRPYTEGTTTVTGTMWRYLYTLPIHFTGQYYITSPNDVIAVYGGAHAGPTMVQQELQIGSVLKDTQTWKFGGKVEAGLYWQFPQSDWGLHGNFAYHMTSYNNWNIETLTNYSISLGFVYRYD